jgi:molecular chaperone DnaK (HSP70)
MPDHFLGIDLGTTFSAIPRIDKRPNVWDGQSAAELSYKNGET